jgi:hypothetical protein
MRLFTCQSCKNTVYFHNSQCVACGTTLGFSPKAAEMVAIEPAKEQYGSRPLWTAVGAQDRFFQCANTQQGVCNWLIPERCDNEFCKSCRHNNLSPDLTVEGNLDRWRKVEQAKQHLFYSLVRWRLPAPTAADGVEEPLTFDLIADAQTDTGTQKVLTGHDAGHITLNIAEADDDEREKRRVAMQEPYRTLLGHFRHEIGHYYWDLLVKNTNRLGEFRTLFGDEQQDYAEALDRYYATGAPADWPQRYISAYSSAHPWEDFAETWAHHMHIVDTLETANALGVSIQPREADSLSADVAFDAYWVKNFDNVVAAWTPVSVALNSLTRSLGQKDAYPFVLSQAVIDKLAFVHELVSDYMPLGH